MSLLEIKTFSYYKKLLLLVYSGYRGQLTVNNSWSCESFFVVNVIVVI